MFVEDNKNLVNCSCKDLLSNIFRYLVEGRYFIVSS